MLLSALCETLFLDLTLLPDVCSNGATPAWQLNLRALSKHLKAFVATIIFVATCVPMPSMLQSNLCCFDRTSSPSINSSIFLSIYKIHTSNSAINLFNRTLLFAKFLLLIKRSWSVNWL